MKSLPGYPCATEPTRFAALKVSNFELSKDAPKSIVTSSETYQETVQFEAPAR